MATPVRIGSAQTLTLVSWLCLLAQVPVFGFGYWASEGHIESFLDTPYTMGWIAKTALARRDIWHFLVAFGMTVIGAVGTLFAMLAIYRAKDHTLYKESGLVLNGLMFLLGLQWGIVWLLRGP